MSGASLRSSETTRDLPQPDHRGPALEQPPRSSASLPLHALWQALPSPVLAADASSLVIVEANPVALALIGSAREQVVGSRLDRFLQPPRLDATRPAPAAPGLPPQTDSTLLTADGRPISVLDSVASVVIEGRNLEVHAFQPVPSLRERVERTRLLERAIEQSMDGIAIADMSGTLTFVNRAWAESHGYAPSELVGAHLSHCHTEEQLRNDVLPFLEAMRRDGWQHGEVGHRRRDGSTFPTWMTSTVIYDDAGVPVAMVGVAHDFTEQKRIEGRLRSAALPEAPGDAPRHRHPADHDTGAARHPPERDLLRLIDRWGTRPARASAQPPPLAAAPVPKALHFEEALARLEGDRALLLDLAALLLEDVPRSLAELREAVEARDHVRVRMIAHGIRGGVSNVGGVETAEAARDLEQAANDQVATSFAPLLAVLDAAWARLADALATLQSAGHGS